MGRKAVGSCIKMKRQAALLVISAFLIGLLPMRDSTVSKAEPDSASAAATPASAAGGTAQTGYGLNNPTTNRNGDTTWDCVWFGNYWQEDTNGDGKADKNDAKQPIKWRVLSVDGDDAFLLADKNLDCQRYHDTNKDITWETSTMRSWLNGYGAEANQEGKDYSRDNFLDDAFTPAEQSAILTAYVSNNNDNAPYPTEGGNDTSDKVYLLSLAEAMNPVYGFLSDYMKYDAGRRAKNTEYAKGRGAWTRTSASAKYAGNGVWWLRSPGDDRYDASSAGSHGSVNWYGDYVDHDNWAVRPALHLNLKASSDAISASSWSYAGTVISEGEIGSAKAVSIKLTQKKRTVTVSWKKVTGAAGYQIRYSTSKKWKGRKQKLSRKNKVTVKNLKKKKTYYFRVRAYWFDGEEKVYGAWSKTKSITIKK